eukprot:2154925-Rhodomonas_salina.2
MWARNSGEEVVGCLALTLASESMPRLRRTRSAGWFAARNLRMVLFSHCTYESDGRMTIVPGVGELCYRDRQQMTRTHWRCNI